MNAPTPIEPDHFVQTALRLLPIPSHRTGFWEDLERALDDETAPAEPPGRRRATELVTGPRHVSQAPMTLVDLDEQALALVPPTLRRRSNVMLLAMAAAAAAVVVFAGTSLVLDRTDTQQVDLANADGTIEPGDDLDALVNGSHPEPSTPDTLSPDSEEASSQAVSEWVDALHDGDADAAWAAMGPDSQDYFGTRSAFDDQLAGMASGFGGWSEADPDDVLVTPVFTDDQGIVAVVTLIGTTEIDGEPQHRADAFPVRLVDGEAHLEPFAFAGELEVVVPEGVPNDGIRPAVAAGEALVIVVPSEAEAPILRLDDGSPVICGQADGTKLVALDGAPGQRCSYLPTTGIDPGEHTLTVAFMGSDGASISAESLLFEAA